MKVNNTVDTYIDTVGLRCECSNSYDRDSIFDELLSFIRKKKMIGIAYDKKRSTKYYQITKLQNSNSILATISKGYFEYSTNGYKNEYYYININFYGLKRYNTIKDDASRLLIKTISAYLNTNYIYFRLTELDVAMDIKSQIENILVVRTRRSANVEYFQLGDKDKDGNKIQRDEGTYYIEKFASNKQRKNAMSRAYLYDKRTKESEKFKRDIGFELTRFEVKLQKRYFVKNEYGIGFLYKALKKYTVLEFKDMKQKEILIQKYNDTKSSKQRRKIIEQALTDNNASLLEHRMDMVGSFLREIDTIKFDADGNFRYTKQKDYLYGLSKFNYTYAKSLFLKDIATYRDYDSSSYLEEKWL